MLNLLAKSAVLLLILGLTMPHASAKLIPTEAEQLESLNMVLGGPHYRVNKRQLQRIGPSVGKLLVIVASEPRNTPTIRTRAVASLRVFPNTRTRRYLDGALYDPELRKTSFGTMLRREAMYSLAVGFRGDSVTALDNHRGDANPQIREGCARALGATQSARALQILEAWLPHEPELFVRVAVDEALVTLRRSLKSP